MIKPTLIEQFHNICGSYGDHIAIQNDMNEITYKELKSSIERLAGFYQEQGVKQGDRVVLVIDNSINYVIAFYAIWQIGAIVVALNPQSKTHEIEKSINLCQAKLLILEQADIQKINSLNHIDINILQLSEANIQGTYSWQDALNSKPITMSLNIKKATAAQIIFTSGTTGDPKGVLLSHHNLLRNTHDITDYLELTNNDSVFNVLPFHYSYGNSVLHTHLSVGAKIILNGSMAFPQDIVDKIRDSKATGFSGVPSTYSLFLNRSDWPDNPPALRYITQAGGPMSKSLIHKLLNTLNPRTKLYIMYGQTEASARISWLPPEYLDKKMGSVGIPLNSVKIEIRDQYGNSLKHNQNGEVYVEGDNIMKEYWNNPNATQKTVINGWLRTGDIGHIDEDGFLFLEGRNNDMIKVGAHRINPLELEEVINKLDFVNESAVIGVDDEILGQKLRAFVVGDESRENQFCLKKHCNEYLPAHKIPREIKWISQLPKTASGKLKRHQLI